MCNMFFGEVREAIRGIEACHPRLLQLGYCGHVHLCPLLSSSLPFGTIYKGKKLVKVLYFTLP